MTYQYWLMSYNKYTINVIVGKKMLSVLSAQFCCKSKTVLKNKVC